MVRVEPRRPAQRDPRSAQRAPRASRGRLVAALLAALLIGAPGLAQDLREERLKGADLSAAEAAALERQLLENPQDLVARARLVGYYQASRRTGAKEHSRHVLWFIQNLPESDLLAGARITPFLDPEGYTEGREEWLRLIEAESDNALLLRNAARYFTVSDDDLAAKLLARGEALEPASPYWPTQLGRNRWREAHNPYRGTDAAIAAQALAAFQRAYELSDPDDCADLMPDLAITAFASGNPETARGHAEAMLAAPPGDRNQGDYLHYGNLVLGRIALNEGNLDEARDRLLAAGRTRSAPLRRFGGPDMALARQLLDRGQAATVLQYLELCLDIWERGERDLRDWITLIEAGRTPDFDHNFVF